MAVFTRSKSVSTPTLGIDARISANVRLRGRVKASARLARCSASSTLSMFNDGCVDTLNKQMGH